MLEINPKKLPTTISAGGVIVRFDGAWYVALTKWKDDASGIWYVPKGHIEGEENLEQAARREIDEEVGLNKFTKWQYLGEKQRESLFDTEWKIIHYFFGVTEQSELQPTATDKIHVAQWFPLFSEVPVCTDEQREIIAAAKEIIKSL
jgi:8-oxo-dGTP pyrophosphatase MutT (NUDIX family)